MLFIDRDYDLENDIRKKMTYYLNNDMYEEQRRWYDYVHRRHHRTYYPTVLSDGRYVDDVRRIEYNMDNLPRNSAYFYQGGVGIYAESQQQMLNDSWNYMNFFRGKEDKMVEAERSRVECRMKAELERQVMYERRNSYPATSAHHLHNDKRIIRENNGCDCVMLTNAFFHLPASPGKLDMERQQIILYKRAKRRELQRRKTESDLENDKEEGPCMNYSI